MSRYTFHTSWRIHAPIEAVWEALSQPERWPAWWPGLERVVDGRFTWKGWLPYRLTVQMRTIRMEPPRLFEAVAEGDLVGRGVWRLEPEPGATLVRYDWTVSVAVRWMRHLELIGRPVFRWNHNIVMRRGGEGLKRLLERGSMDRGDDALEERLLKHPECQDAQHQGGEYHLGQVAHLDR